MSDKSSEPSGKSRIPLIPDKEFTRLATDEQIARAARTLEATNIHTIVVETGEQARKLVVDLLPEGVEVLI